MKNRIITITCLISLICFIGLITYIKNRPGKDTPAPVQSGDLIINTDKSQYKPKEEVYIQITSLDHNEKTDCDSDLELTISDIDTPYSTFNIPVSNSPTCNPSGTNSNSPDYYAYFKPESDGTYKLTLSDKDGGNSVETQISVGEAKYDISVSRWGPTRLTSNGSNRYPMIITVSANSDFEGTISDKIPQGFNFAWYGSATLTTSGPGNSQNIISWDVNLKEGETKELKYEYIPSVGQVSSTIGPISISSDGTTQEIGNEWSLILQRR